MNNLSVTVGGGKYTVIQEESGTLAALRYGEPWRDLCGDGWVLALAVEIQRLRDKLGEIARQHTVAEFEEELGNDAEDLDWDLGYDHCIETARAALNDVSR